MIEFYAKSLDKLSTLNAQHIKDFDFVPQIEKFSRTLEITKAYLTSKKDIKLERHLYAPELNILHIGTQQIKVGFFEMKVQPTLIEAITYASNKGLITKNMF